MKNSLFLLIMLAFFGSSINAQVTTTDQVNSPYTPIEKLLDATIICLDAVEAPTKYNEFAKQFINTPSFPIKKVTSTKEEYQKEINDWLIANPVLVDKILSDRKKAHDILYGPRPY